MILSVLNAKEINSKGGSVVCNTISLCCVCIIRMGDSLD